MDCIYCDWLYWTSYLEKLAFFIALSLVEFTNLYYRGLVLVFWKLYLEELFQMNSYLVKFNFLHRATRFAFFRTDFFAKYIENYSMPCFHFLHLFLQNIISFLFYLLLPQHFLFSFDLLSNWLQFDVICKCFAIVLPW